MSVRILLVDDHKIMRDGLRGLLEEQSGMEVVAEAENGRKALRLAHELKPDVVIMDIGMPEMNGLDATRQIKADCPGIKVIALSMHSQRQFVVGMIKAGVAGYLLKDCAFEELTRAIRTVVDNQIYLSPQIAGTVIEDYTQRLSAECLSDSPVLTPREREVLQLVAEGRMTRQIANCLHVSVKTVETHRRNIMEKLNVYSTAELTKFAIREGLTLLEC
ncbi:MAG: response regulator transcription factor [Desulfobacterales bacterium]|nr:MAG: response regulator transcription factor [Desulfobacterales bacterium]